MDAPRHLRIPLSIGYEPRSFIHLPEGEMSGRRVSPATNRLRDKLIVLAVNNLPVYNVSQLFDNLGRMAII